MKDFKKDDVKAQVLEQCYGRQECDVEVDNSLFGMSELTRNYDQFVFLQVACQQDEEMLFLKKVMGLCASVIGLLICLVYRNTLVVYQTTNMINDKIYDGKLITLGDYSVQGKISQYVWDEFMKS